MKPPNPSLIIQAGRTRNIIGASEPISVILQRTLREAMLIFRPGISIDSNMTSPFFRFLDLPRELRDCIYLYVLCPSSQQPHVVWSAHRGRLRSLAIVSALLRANKQVYYEAKAYLYEKSKATCQIDFGGGNGAIHGADFGGPDSAPRGELYGYEYILRPGPHGPEIHQRNLLSDRVSKDCEAKDDNPSIVFTLAPQRQVPQDQASIRGAITGAVIACSLHLELTFEMRDLWQRCNKYEGGRQGWRGLLLMYLLEVLASRDFGSAIAARGSCRTLTLTMHERGHEYMPSGSLGEEIARNKRMLELLRAIRAAGTTVRIVRPQVKQDRRYRVQEEVGGANDNNITATDVFRNGHYHKPNCEYCRLCSEGLGPNICGSENTS